MALSFRIAKKAFLSFSLGKGFFLLLLLSTHLLSAVDTEEEAENIVVLPSTAVVNRDLFLSGGSVEVAGTVNGDLYVVGKQIFIDGTVNGDVLVVGGSVTISGEVSHAVRVLGGQVEISGRVGRNVTALAATVELTSNADIGLSVVVFAGNASLACSVGKDVRLHASTARFSGDIKGDLFASVGQMRMTSTAHIDGSFEYWSDNQISIDPQAFVGGGIVHHPSFFYELFQKQWVKGVRLGSKLAGIFMNFFYSLIMGLILMRYFPGRIERANRALSTHPVQVLIAGLIVLVVLPLSCLMLLVTILGLPFALGLLSITVVSFYTAKLLTLFWLSERVFARWKWRAYPRLFFIVSLIVYFALTLIPYLGMAVSVLALLFGLGSLVLAKQRSPEKKIEHKVGGRHDAT